VAYRQRPTVEDSVTTVADITNVIDQSLLTTVTMVKDELLYCRLEVPTDIGELTDPTGGSPYATIRIRFGVIGNLSTADIKYLTPTPAPIAPTVDDTSSNLTVTRATETGITWEKLGDWAFGLTAGSDVSTSVVVKHIVVEYYVKNYSQGRGKRN